MAISVALVNRYASALVDVVLGPSSGVTPAQAVEQLRTFEKAVAESKDLRMILASPAVPVARKRTVIRRMAEALELAPIVRNFILVLSDHRRAASLAEMIAAFEIQVDQRLGFVPAEVRTAFELSEQQRESLASELGRLAGAQVKMRFTVDPALIGGVTARIGSKVYDGSVRGQLASMRQRLALQR